MVIVALHHHVVCNLGDFHSNCRKLQLLELNAFTLVIVMIMPLYPTQLYQFYVIFETNVQCTRIHILNASLYVWRLFLHLCYCHVMLSFVVHFYFVSIMCQKFGFSLRPMLSKIFLNG